MDIIRYHQQCHEQLNIMASEQTCRVLIFRSKHAAVTACLSAPKQAVTHAEPQKGSIDQ